MSTKTRNKRRSTNRQASPVYEPKDNNELLIQKVICANNQTKIETAEMIQQILREDPTPSRWRPTRRLPEYTGITIENPARFLQRVENILEQQNTYEEDYVAIVIEQLQGLAKEWAIPLYNLGITWTSFKKEFLAKFNSPLKQTEIRTTFFGEKQAHQTASLFARSKSALWLRMNDMEGPISEQTAVQTVLELLHPSYRIPLRGNPPTDFDTLIEKLTVLDQDIPPITHGKNITPPKIRVDIPTKKPTNKVPYCKYCTEYHLYRDCPVLRTRNLEKLDNPGNFQRAGPSTQP